MCTQDMEYIFVLVLCSASFASAVEAKPEIKNVPLDGNKAIYIRDANRFRGNLDATAMREVKWSDNMAEESFRDAEILLTFFGCSVEQMECENCNDKLVNLLLQQKTFFHVNMNGKNFSTGIGRMFSFLGSKKSTLCDSTNELETGFQTCHHNEYKVFDHTEFFGCSIVQCKYGGRDIHHLVCKFQATRKIRPKPDQTSTLYRQASSEHEMCSECPAIAPSCYDGLCVPIAAASITVSQLATHSVATVVTFCYTMYLF